MGPYPIPLASPYGHDLTDSVTQHFSTSPWHYVRLSSRYPVALVQASYDRNVTDEFIEPHVVKRDGRPIAPFRDGDSLICVNFRSDRMRQIIRALSDSGFDGFPIGQRPSIEIVTMTSYDRTFDLPVAFAPQSMANIVAEVVSKSGKTMFRTAETEKYAHVTYFFNGGEEKKFPGEDRLIIPSKTAASYDLIPEMSAYEITDGS